MNEGFITTATTATTATTSTMSNTAPNENGSTGGGDGSSTEIENPRDTDVLCGRGGAALRHPGNQTYRRLVSLNKGLYITCLKTEKLKISRSIVAAIREQNGRFLERDSAGKWYDIGDKKAIEKTSQALREGQPKLRQKIVEMGGPGTGGMMDTFSNGAYPPPGANGGFDAYGNSSGEVTGIPPQPDAAASAVHRLSQQQQQLAAAAAGLQQQQDVAAVAAHRLSQQQQQLAAAAAGLQQQEAVVSQRLSQQHQQLAAAAAGLQQQQDAAVVAAHRLSQQQQQLAAAAAGLQQQQDMTAAVHRMSQQQMVGMPDPIQRHESGSEMPPPPARPESHADLMQRLSIREGHPSGTADVPTSMNSLPPKAHQLRPSLVQRGSGVGMELGVQESTFSLMSDFSSFAGSATTVSMANESLLSMDPSIGKARAMNRGSAGLLDPTPIGSVSEHHTVFSHGSAHGSAHGSTMSEQSSTKPGLFNTSLDRRKYFAKMKYTRPASGRFPKPMSSSQHSLGDGMPDIHMVDSTMSLFSNVSSVGAESAKMSAASGETGMAAAAMAAAAAVQQQQLQQMQQMQQQQLQQMAYSKPPSGMDYNKSVKSIPSELGGILDSRRSLMSGLSRISDASEVNSLFSDLSKKIGNVSTRSMAMSEISGIDAQLRDEEEDEEESICDTGPIMTANSLDHTVTSHNMQQQFDDPRRTPTTPMSANNMDFDL